MIRGSAAKGSTRSVVAPSVAAPPVPSSIRHFPLPCPVAIPVLYHDDSIIVLDKPHGLLSVPGIGEHKRDCLATRVAAEHPAARILHRLDRDTSGVIVMALNADAHRELSRQFHDREVEKTYIAVAIGAMEKEAGTIDLPMRKDMNPVNKPRHVIDFESGRAAITHWRVLSREKCDGAVETRLELRPITGRSHQLRLHLQAIGHPIVGDDLYAPPEVVVLAPRLLLHAHTLTITHPRTKQRMTFTAPCPF
jgi:tRNA pseudouridine32 synthase / 23S rRNA pseudouridine746 synthase